MKVCHSFLFITTSCSKLCFKVGEICILWFIGQHASVFTIDSTHVWNGHLQTSYWFNIYNDDDLCWFFSYCLMWDNSLHSLQLKKSKNCRNSYVVNCLTHILQFFLLWDNQKFFVFFLGMLNCQNQSYRYGTNMLLLILDLLDKSLLCFDGSICTWYNLK